MSRDNLEKLIGAVIAVLVGVVAIWFVLNITGNTNCPKSKISHWEFAPTAHCDKFSYGDNYFSCDTWYSLK